MRAHPFTAAGEIMIDLISALRVGQTVRGFIEGGPLTDALADLGLEAALDALGKSPDARDRRSQVWSAVNHLEAANAAYSSVVNKRGKFLTWTAPAHLELVVNRRRYILCLMAICYRYLEEEKLCHQALQHATAKDYYEQYLDEHSIAHILGMLPVGFTMIIINPSNWFAQIREGFEFNKKEAGEVREKILSLPPGELPPQLPPRG
ncbi:hypothetical protein [Streptomyces sp. NBC_00203]|uniref:hypothetical protein n=1 Tax=Streptomyces sp. NBC_00203 TaxID=2975680 RepID=UPI00324E830E